MGKKEKERWYLDRFLDILPSFSHTEITAGESPDFLVEGAQGVVGVELTELHRLVPQGVTPGQAKEALRERVVARAKELFDASNSEPLYVSALFNESTPITRSGVEPLAAKIAELLRSNCPAPGEQYEEGYDWENRARVPEEVHRLAAYNVPNSSRSLFCAPGATWVGTLRAADLQRVLDAKERKTAAYRSDGKETWLVIVHDTNRMSTWFDTDSPLPAGPFVSSFDRVFVFNLFSNKLTELNVSPAPET